MSVPLPRRPADPTGPLRPTSLRRVKDLPASWQQAYVVRMVAGDLLCATVGTVVGYLVRFGTDTDPIRERTPPAWLAALLPLVWVLAMHLGRAYERRFLWIGPEEYHRVFGAAVMLLAGVATFSWAFKLELARGFVVVALPMATLLTLAARYGHRTWLNRQRTHGRFGQTALVVGHRKAVTALVDELRRESYHGYRAIGCCVPARGPSASEELLDGIPVLGGLDDVVAVVQRYGVDSVAVLPCPELDGPALRRLGWDLETTHAELLLAPAVTEIAGPRVRIRPVCGLPLLHMERPELRGLRRLTKLGVDLIGSSLLVLLLLPALVAIALAVRYTSRGPVFYKQHRMGRGGRTFAMLKFRTMVVGADTMLADLSSANQGNGVLFKIHDDPRITRVGRVLRRYSLDELPQLLNVLKGDMSLVGPRPPLQTEAERYGFDMRRRFLVKPGITGLWQVSGRSDLSWDDSVRVDVRYVENWSLAFDLLILWKTFGAVRRGSGAY
jgi:exopolysaccharide biosynthesis polyprenyl glycosylphosphotransferase